MQRMGAILILDNDHMITDLLSEILSDEGYVVHAPFHWASGHTSFPAQSPALILLDDALPAITVAAAQEYARSYPARVPIVMTTTSHSIAPSITRSCVECLVKPFEIDDLLVCVARYVRLPRSSLQRLFTADSSDTALMLSGNLMEC